MNRSQQFFAVLGCLVAAMLALFPSFNYTCFAVPSAAQVNVPLIVLRIMVVGFVCAGGVAACATDRTP